MGVELGRWGGRVIWEELVGEEKLVIKIYIQGNLFSIKRIKTQSMENYLLIGCVPS